MRIRLNQQIRSYNDYANFRVQGGREGGAGGGGRGGGGGCVGGGSWTGSKILLYLIMYRKYVRKSPLSKRNRIICPEIAEICHENSEFCIKLLEKSKVFPNLP